MMESDKLMWLFVYLPDLIPVDKIEERVAEVAKRCDFKLEHKMYDATDGLRPVKIFVNVMKEPKFYHPKGKSGMEKWKALMQGMREAEGELMHAASRIVFDEAEFKFGGEVRKIDFEWTEIDLAERKMQKMKEQK